jgi:hypothetical protein
MSYEPGQNGLAESFVGSMTMLGNTRMAESRLAGLFWFCATQNGVISRNVTFNQSFGTTPFEKVYGIKKDVSKFRPFGCQVYCT